MSSAKPISYDYFGVVIAPKSKTRKKRIGHKVFYRVEIHKVGTLGNFYILNKKEKLLQCHPSSEIVSLFGRQLLVQGLAKNISKPRAWTSGNLEWSQPSGNPLLKNSSHLNPEI